MLKIIFIFAYIKQDINRMGNIDLSSIIETHGLNKKVIAEHLFPDNKYSSLALNRIISGEANLDSEQLSKLALLLNVGVSDLYNPQFKISSSNDLLTFEAKDYKAVLDMGRKLTKIFHKGSLFHETVLHQGTITLSQYIKELTELINKHKNDEQNN